jgi:uncharacterized membrane protein HdeD (DUF308 family)
MSTASTYGGDVPASPPRTAEAGALAAVAKLWWLWLVAGIFWCVAALVVLQFDQASVTTVGILVGAMFVVAGLQQMIGGMIMEEGRWLSWIFGGLFLVCGVVALIRPVNTFAGLADTLGFLFLVFGIWWTIEPFLLRSSGSPLWWLGFVTGPIMILTAFWTSGQFFIEKAYMLLVFAGIWALAKGLGDIVKAFRIRALRDPLA